MPAVTAVVVEIGPAAVHRIPPSAAEPSPSTLTAALAGVDDTIVLLDERPVEVSALWRSIIESMLESASVRLTIVVPSWWSQRRVSRLTEAAATVAAEVVVIPRSRIFAGGAGDDVIVIEIADDVIAVTAGDAIALLPRSCDPETVARAAPDGPRLVIDAPVGVVGVDEAAGRIRSALEAGGRAAEIVPIGEAVPAILPAPTPESTRRSPFTPAVVAGAAVAAVMCAVGVTMAHPRSSSGPGPSVDTTDLVEGRVTIRVPARWTVTRATVGPGSKRVQVTSTGDGDVALHITQSYVPGESLDATAEVLQRELDKQPPGVFTDFRPHGQRAGRAVVSYREVRGSRDISWVVLVDGATRIAIGCQSAVGRADAVGAVGSVCDEAVHSAREISGTIVQR